MATQPDRLSEALLGLTLLALDRPRAEHPRLVEQFLGQYPEIVLSGDVVTLRGALDRVEKALGSIKPGSLATIDTALDVVSDVVNDDQIYQAWRPRT